MSSDWLTEQLSSILDFPVPSNLVEYIEGMTNERDLEEYMKTLLDLNIPKHKKFLQEFLQKRKVAGIKGGYKKSEVTDYILPKQTERKKKGGKTQTEEVQENIEQLQTLQPTSYGKKKTKYVNLYSQEGQNKDVILLKGRHKCDCQASKHALINNCLKCGRVVCEQEGSGPCMFCSNLVCSRMQQDILNSGTKQSSQLLQKLMDQKAPGWEAAMEQRNRLLEYDKTSEKRTRVIDDESDYFSTDSVWLSPQERERLKQREEEQKARRYRSRREQPLTLDIIGCRLVESSDSQADDVIDDNSDRVLQDISLANYENIKLGCNNVDPTVQVVPVFEESVVDSHPKYRYQDNYFKTTDSMRIQDKEYLEMVDEGRCLSMHQPWASLLIAGIKIHEGRTWYTSHRGRLWIAATAKVPTQEEIKELENMYRVLLGNDIKFPETYPVGCLLGCVTVTNCLPQEEYRQLYPEGESESPFVFICEDPQDLPVRFPIKGKHKIYHLDSQIHEAATKCLQRLAKLKAERASKK